VKIIALTLFAAGTAAFAGAAPPTWTIDPNHSAAQFAVRHLAVSTVRGEFGNIRGTIVFDDADPSKTTIEATIDAATVNTRVAGRDADLRGPGFFDVANHPQITFRSTSVEPAGPNAFAVTGDLTIRGVTKPVTLRVEATAPVKDPKGNARRGAEATTTLSRKAFGVSADPGIVGDEVKVTIDLEAVRKAD
jgi:polyisoprenoid-binding protein YceI